MISQKTKSTLTILVGTLIVVLGTVVIVAMSSGYSLDIFNGELTSTGLVKLGTNPSGAAIKINSKQIRQKTPYQLENAKIGPVKIEYSREGYYDWSANFNVVGGEVIFADYALLIPKNIQQEKITTEISFSSIVPSQSHNKLFAVTQSGGSIYEIQKNSQLKKIVGLPLNDSLKAPDKLSDFIVSADGSSMIATARYPEGPSVRYWLDLNNGSVVNLDSLIGDSSTNLVISPRNPKDVYFIKAGILARANTDNRSILNLPISNITAFGLDRDHIYSLENLNPASNGQFLVRYDFSGNDRYVLAQYATAAKPWQITLSNFAGSKYVALVGGDDKSLYVVREKDNIVFSSKLGGQVKLVDFSPTGRFLSFVQSENMRTIDIEFYERFSLPLPSTNSLSWLTDYQIILQREDGPYIVDYNGFNLIKLPTNLPSSQTGTSASFFKDPKTIYYISEGQIFHYSLQPRGGLINLR